MPVISNQAVLAIPRTGKRFIAVSADVVVCVLATWLAFAIRLEAVPPLSAGFAVALGASILFAIPLFITSGFYRAVFRYTGWQAFTTIYKTLLIYGLLYASVFTVVGIAGVPRSVGILQPLLVLIGINSSRSLIRIWLGNAYQRKLRHTNQSRQAVLIYGAGSAGRQLANALSDSAHFDLKGFVDDDPRLHRQIMAGTPVHSPDNLASMVQRLGIKQILVAIPSATAMQRRAIISKIEKLHVQFKTLPGLTDLVSGKAQLSDLRKIEIEELLARDPVAPIGDLLYKNINGKTVMVTGAGGSIGAELVRQIYRLAPKAIVMVDHSEFALYQIHQELEDQHHKAQFDSIDLFPVLASVCDANKMRTLLKRHRPDIIFHAAAYKHVPMVEENIAEGIFNNVFGTLTLGQLVLDLGLPQLVLVSTDKAVRPTSMMGASKRLAELVLQSFETLKQTSKFSMVRFGNVLNSSGSVIPRFRQQIRAGGPITLTHPETVRFFMTISEAAQLVIQASALSKGGDVFVLDMGEPVKIIDLAKRMIHLYGLTIRDEAHPQGDIAIEVTGLRPGEKLYEELLIGNDPQATLHPRIFRAMEPSIDWAHLEQKLLYLQQLLNNNDQNSIRTFVMDLVNPDWKEQVRIMIRPPALAKPIGGA